MGGGPTFQDLHDLGIAGDRVGIPVCKSGTGIERQRKLDAHFDFVKRSGGKRLVIFQQGDLSRFQAGDNIASRIEHIQPGRDERESAGLQGIQAEAGGVLILGTRGGQSGEDQINAEE